MPDRAAETSLPGTFDRLECVEDYLRAVGRAGFRATWERMIESLRRHPEGDGIVTLDRIGPLYEIGLAHLCKTEKKAQGQYFTPDDTAALMAAWFAALPGRNLCDVCCGTGKLILAVLARLGRRRARSLISAGRLYLYDIDPLALKISRSLIGILYGSDLEPKIRTIAGDFLSDSVRLPEKCKVISNPPYSKIGRFSAGWNRTENLLRSKELYSAIMEKILDSSRASVVITPYSFLGGEKFFPLRTKMNQKNGFIVSFDNVPGNIFYGRKKGIFNTNSANSVRAAITVTENRPGDRGYRCSPLIRFKNEERAALLQEKTLRPLVSGRPQTVSAENPKYQKCFPALEKVLDRWKACAEGTVLAGLLAPKGAYTLCVPNTCRYYSVAAARNLRRQGKYTLSFDDKMKWGFAYCLINSSFCYWHWRLYDGGITYPVSLLKEMPAPYFTLTGRERNRFLKAAETMAAAETGYLVYKKNAGAFQENIKFPEMFRTTLNNLLLKAIGLPQQDSSLFDPVHANTIVPSLTEGRQS